MNNHLEQLIKFLEENELDLAYLSDPTNIFYYTGFLADPHERTLAFFVDRSGRNFLFTPALEVSSAHDAGFSGEVYGYLDEEDPYTKISEHLARLDDKFNRVGIEKSQLTVSRFEQLKRILPQTAQFLDLTSAIESQRLIKTEDEIAKMIAAGSEADYAFEIAQKYCRPGITEVELVNEIESALRKKGVLHVSFDTLVQAGKMAANPHGEPTTNQVADHDLVLFDLGTVHDNYVSDATRTFAVGSIDDRQRDIYEVCLEAQLAAMDFAKPGVTASQLDKVARNIISEHGYGEYFNHRLGHGLGISVHEFPSIMAGNDLVLTPGMCFSIEPGIYIPGFAGVRIEDSVYVTENGVEPFTHSTKELVTL
ncbi:M24 family metallopeptidase [Xylocopilactobacillus apicola]|uniref:Dipeptidase n=1 Tax=Xylocopilactobacillus apicola TaxID=2932184 RepID=A0AAU9CXQ2_9LACO|nr:Xaa-Pro peptidase family protein [Xylocopilactobacillus apicola]BDR58784.1 dipeptidase [Xylocopilactobacillus apicola]